MKYLFALSIALLAGTAQAQTVIDKVVAQVGDNIVLLSDVQAQKIQAIQAGMKPDRSLDCQIIEDMMYQFLLLNQAQLDSVEISDQQVDAEMENRLRMIENTIGGRDKMEEFYGKSVTEIKEEFRPVIKDQLLSREMEHILTSEISVTPREVEKFYKELPFDSIPLINAQMSFQQIVIYPKITESDKKRSFDQLQEIRNDIVRNGKSFATQARIHSMDPGSAADGGTITATRGMMVPQFESAVFDLQPGDVSDVFETEYGYHIVKLNERKGDNYVCQHILIIPEYTNNELESAAYRMDSCYNKLINREITWEEAVLKYSNDEATMQNRGIITNPITGEQMWDIEDLNQVDQQIYLLTDNMDKGDISQPNIYYNAFERKQGVRIVRLMDRTTPHRANLQDDYTLIKRAAENQKRQEIIADWAKTHIEKVYVRVDEEYKDCDFRFAWKLH